ncbi:MAG: malto-oligosyltrehalose synthase [Pseudomonadota bacterium]
MSPRATYRLQLNRDFGFAEAAGLVPYLAALGISHCYLSPYLKARAGSSHGYDIVDHNRLNPELGSRRDFDVLIDTLRSHGMGHILDLVPNHMGVGGDDNQWWLDLLEHGRASPYASFFDIDWYPNKEELRGRVLVPVLGDHYGKVLERGELVVRFDEGHGELSVCYMGHRFPLDPRTYPKVLSINLKRLERQFAKTDMRLQEFKTLLNAFAHLPARSEISAEKIEERRRDHQVYKQQLARLCAEYPEISAHIFANLDFLNGNVEGEPGYNALHRILEAQAYRLAYWRVASDEINYRRFFDINDLAGLSMERGEVFHETHKLVLELVRNGQLDGLRLDHPDGLYDPAGYFERLNAALSEAGAAGRADNQPCYLVAEKILALDERLPEQWPLHGTTGYDFANQVNGLFVYPEAERELDRIYRSFTGTWMPFAEMVYRSKRLVMEVQMFGELATLGRLLDHITECNRNTRDYTGNSLRNALKEIVACFPVYRTYITKGAVSEMDRRYIDQAVTEAKQRSPAADTTVFDFIRNLLQEGAYETEPARSDEITHFVMRFQQYTAPVTAKALEDTSLYNYNRLLSLNEVGGDPSHFGISLEAFHASAKERIKQWPASMLATSTHDNKRSEDVRARLNVLSEIPALWKKQLGLWSRSNRRHRRQVDTTTAPTRNDEYHLYQTLLGSWPLEPMDEQGLEYYRQRIQDYMRKAIREAKLHTSWINVNEAYEKAVADFVERLLSGGEKNAFLEDFVPFAHNVARLGLYNSLSQTLLKLTTPGVPDIYQGCELWDFSLVDPDNRRPVDYDLRSNLLKALTDRDSDLAALWPELLENFEDGRAKLLLVQRLLRLRRDHPLLFENGDYLPLEVQGEHAGHLCAFSRRNDEAALIVIAPRWFVSLCGEEQRAPIGQSVWGETAVILPDSHSGTEWTNLLDGASLRLAEQNGRLAAPLAQVLRTCPAGVLFNG